MELETLLGDLLERQGGTFNVSDAFAAQVTGAQTTANTALANAATALAAANEADDTADAAQTTANTALANAATAQATADAKVSVAGQIGGTASSPDVRGIRETSGPTLLSIGELASGGVVVVSGAVVQSRTPANLLAVQHAATRTIYRPDISAGAGSATTTTQTIYACYLGFVMAGTTIQYVRGFQTTLAAGAGQAELGIASSVNPPSGASQTLTVLAAGVAEDLTINNNRTKKNVAAFGHTLASDTHLWALFRGEFVTTQPQFRTIIGGYDLDNYNCMRKTAQPSLTTLVGAGLTTWLDPGNAFPTPYIAATTY